MRYIKNKKGAMGEGIQMTYRLFLIMAIATIVLGTSSIVLGVYINVRDAEARILANQILDCLDNEGKIDLDLISINYRDKILDYCNINNTERFFIKVDFLKENNNFMTLQHGDSGKKTIKKILENNQQDSLKIYEPGYFSTDFNFLVLYNKDLINSRVKMEVLVVDEEVK